MLRIQPGAETAEEGGLFLAGAALFLGSAGEPLCACPGVA